MDYDRMRTRNGLMFRKPDEDPDPYWRNGLPPGAFDAVNWFCLVGDMNRMERDYLNPDYPRHRAANSDPASVTAAATGVPVEMVRKVLAHVFLGQVL